MSIKVPGRIPREALSKLIAALADDELVLGHRNSEWTGHSPILEEDIAFSNIAQDELGHSLAWYTLHEELTGKSPDSMAFERPWNEFTCSRFVSYPKGDFAYTVMRQYLFDTAEQVRLKSLAQSSFSPLSDLSAKILAEEAYHLMHSQGLVERLGDATEESHRRMQAALTMAFPQAIGMFETFIDEEKLVQEGVITESRLLKKAWLNEVVPVLTGATLSIPKTPAPDDGGRRGNQTEYLQSLVRDLQLVFQSDPLAHW